MGPRAPARAGPAGGAAPAAGTFPRAPRLSARAIPRGALVVEVNGVAGCSHIIKQLMVLHWCTRYECGKLNFLALLVPVDGVWTAFALAHTTFLTTKWSNIKWSNTKWSNIKWSNIK